MTMKKAQIAVLGVALAAGAGAYLLMPSQQPQPVQVVKPVAPVIDNDDVLVAAVPLDYGKVLDETMMHWQAWPKSSPIQGVIRKSAEPNAIQDLKGSIVRGGFLA
ncbi:MAG: Flp pilus assembly protein CpaB, partial [Hyphomicrobiales bacterium]|nr:Flp pilus assembly protein CpaB [Hyphomicrobiales bacterium]